MRTAVILTAIDVETEHVLRHLGETKLKEHHGHFFRVGRFEGANGGWEIAVAQERGNDMAAFNATMAILHFNPDVALFVGVAGGVKDAAIGDAVVSTEIYGFETGKVEKDGFFARPKVYQPDHRLLGLARDLARSGDWKSRRQYSQPKDSRTTHFGPIAAGEKLVVSHDAELMEFIKTRFNDTLAIETEGRGFAAAAHALRTARWLVIRGVSDLLTGKSEADAKDGQSWAVDNAAALAFQLLSELPADTPTSGGRGAQSADTPTSGGRPAQSADSSGEPTEASERQRWWAAQLGREPVFPLKIPSLGVEIPMALIPPGEFTMGSRISPQEFPPQSITIPQPFAISCTTVPVWLFARWRPDVGGALLDMPAVNVDWQTAVDFTAWLSQRTGSRIRLPSEAAWEYAVRAGMDTDFWCGAQPLGDFNVAPLGGSGAGRGRSPDCRQRRPESLGTPPRSRQRLGMGVRRLATAPPPATARWRGLGRRSDRPGDQGGSCRDSAVKARSASRSQRTPSLPSDVIGFRIVMDLR